MVSAKISNGTVCSVFLSVICMVVILDTNHLKDIVLLNGPFPRLQVLFYNPKSLGECNSLYDMILFLIVVVFEQTVPVSLIEQPNPCK